MRPAIPLAMPLATRFAGSLALRLAIFLGVLSSCIGCSQTVDDIVAKYKAPTLAMIAKVKALQPRVKATPRYSAASVSPVKDMVVFRNGFGNTLVIHERDLLHPETFAYTPERPDFADEAFSCITDTQRHNKDGSGAAPWTIEKNLATCASLKYVLVMRTHQRRMAQMVGGTSFMGGRVDGDVVAFTLAGHPLGGFAWHAQSSDAIPVAMNATQADMQFALDAHMRDEVERAILDEIKRNWGSAAAW